MLKLSLCIHGTGSIAPEAAPGAVLRRLAAVEPGYAGIIPPMQLRRMSKGVRMGIGAGMACLADAGVVRPDGIAAGTAFGCLQETENFLSRMVSQDEQMLTPTAFIGSTHNTVAGQLALLTGCKGLNTTVSQRGHSFEGAVMNAAMHLTTHPDANVLCGGVDELTDTAYDLIARAGGYGGTSVAGEGAGFLLLNNIAAGAKTVITGLEMFTESNAATAGTRLEQLLLHGRTNGDALYLCSVHPAIQSLVVGWTGEVVAGAATTGEWSTSVAVHIARIAAQWPGTAQRVWVVQHGGCGACSVWLLARGL